MSKNIKTPIVDKDEIDLGNVLNMIGKLFEKLFNFIKEVSKLIFDLLIKLALLIKQNILKFIIVGGLSIALGLTLDLLEEPTYFSTMTIKPNYNSTSQVYSDIRYYDGLAGIQDSIKLAEIFNIPQEKASKLTTFFINPKLDENKLLEQYYAFKKEVDSGSVEALLNVNYQKFKLNINPEDFDTHIITVGSEDPLIFKKLEKQIVERGFTSNTYLKKEKEKEFKNYDLTEKALLIQEKKIDSLRSIYNKVLIKNAEKVTSSGTNIQLAANQIKTNEMDLFDLENSILEKKQEINEGRILKENIVNVLSGFQERGKPEKELLDQKAIQYFLIGISGLFLFLLLRGLNIYLNNYKKENNA